MADGLRFDVDDNGVGRALGELADDLRHLDGDLQQIGEQLRDVAVPLTPVASGALVDSLTVTATGDSLELSSDLEYAGVQDRGWPARNITGHRFMQAVEEVAEEISVAGLETAIDQLLGKSGLDKAGVRR